jgi:GDP-L-fucose synthase
MPEPGTLDRSVAIYVAGHRGLAGSAIWRLLAAEGFTNLIGRTSAELDLRDRHATFRFLAESEPEIIVLAAARVGGILASSSYPAEFLSDNLRIQLNVLDAARTLGIRRLLFLASSCIYPRHSRQPVTEDALLGGPLEPTRDAFAIAKIAGVLHIQALRRQYGVQYTCAVPTSLYGRNDNFDLHSAHVLPAMIRRFHQARREGATGVTFWGTGTARREFLHADDLASACLFLLENYDGGAAPVNIGTGTDLSIGELAQLIASIVGFRGRVEFDQTRPDGTPQLQLDTSRLSALGWKAQVQLADGIADTYAWYRSHADRSATRR